MWHCISQSHPNNETWQSLWSSRSFSSIPSGTGSAANCTWPWVSSWLWLKPDLNRWGCFLIAERKDTNVMKLDDTSVSKSPRLGKKTVVPSNSSSELAFFCDQLITTATYVITRTIHLDERLLHGQVLCRLMEWESNWAVTAGCIYHYLQVRVI